MALTSRSGLWRLRAFKAFARYKIEKTPNDGFWIQHPDGRFHCADFASLIQFDPTWEPEVRKLVEGIRGRLFLDIGANIGLYSVIAAKNGNYSISIEPDKKAFRCLLDNAEANSLTARIEAHNVVAWSDNAEVRFKPGRHTDTGGVSGAGIPIKAVSIDSLLEGRIPTLVKIDAEGSEPQILRGMPETLEAHPKIIFEALTESKLDECKRELVGYSIDRLDRTNYYAS